MNPIRIRHAEPADYEPIISVINDWWGGRNMCDMLPRLFFVHFRQTSFVAEDNANLVGFLTGFISQTFPEEAYIHFAGVHPEFRQRGVGRALYERLFSVVTSLGCQLVVCHFSIDGRDLGHREVYNFLSTAGGRVLIA
jgi:GNAT superfamily N-acetyltransferase